MFIEQRKRSIIKTISWRVLATITTTLLVYAFIGKIDVAVTVGGIEVFLKMLLYFFHERWWNNIKYGRKEIKPAVIWLTGLPCSGKTTIAEGIVKKLKSKDLKVEHLDGDNIRELFSTTGYSKEERDRHIKRVGHLASKLEKNGVFVVASFISPYEEARKFVRGLCNNFIEVYVSTPIEICEKRDNKGLYAKARNNEVRNFTGVDAPYEKPLKPDVYINTAALSINKAIHTVLKELSKYKDGLEMSF